MQRKILIIDDHDDLASSLRAAFSALGHAVEVLETREDAIAIENIDDFDLVITDLDVHNTKAEQHLNGNNGTCLPEPTTGEPGERIKAFKLCATNFRRDEFDENELKDFVETVLNFKNLYVDKANFVRHLHEKIEFELPSAISPMHSILDYLTKRVEKLGVVDANQ